MYGAQLATITAQLIYAAITSRFVSDTGFGAYAIALTVSSVIGLFANGGLGQTVARMQTLDRDTLRSLLTFAVILGLFAAGLLLATAEFWAWLWGASDAATPIRWCAVGAFVAPGLGLSTGLLLREGRFRSLAIATLVTNIFGFALGAIVVLAFRSGASLLASALTAQVALAITVFVLSRGRLLGLTSLRAARAHLMFSWQVTAQNLGSWLSGSVGSWTISRVFAPAILGQWNRGDVLTTIPFQQVQNAMVQAVYPEFRHDIDGPTRARHVWPDLLGLVAWLALPLAGAAAVVAPALIPVLFGAGWGLAATFSSALSVIAATRMVRVLLGTAVEALGRYIWMWAGIAIEFAFVAGGALGAGVAHNFWLVLLGIGAGIVAAHIAHILLCWRAGYLDARVLLGHYAGALAGGLAAAGISWLIVVAITQAQAMPFIVILAAIALLVVVGGAWQWGHLLPPVRLAKKYGLLPRRFRNRRLPRKPEA